MKITGPGPLRSAPTRRKSGTEGASKGSFARELSNDANVGAPAGAAPANPVEALLAIQEVPDATTPGKRAVQRGNDLLDRLDDIRLALLDGRMPKETLDALVRTVKARRDRVSDPKLREVLDEIELRAMVEIAKLSQASAS